MFPNPNHVDLSKPTSNYDTGTSEAAIDDQITGYGNTVVWKCSISKRIKTSKRNTIHAKRSAEPQTDAWWMKRRRLILWQSANRNGTQHGNRSRDVHYWHRNGAWWNLCNGFVYPTRRNENRLARLWRKKRGNAGEGLKEGIRGGKEEEEWRKEWEEERKRRTERRKSRNKGRKLKTEEEWSKDEDGEK